MSWYARSRERTDGRIASVRCLHEPAFGSPYERVREYPFFTKAEYILDINRDEFSRKEGYFPVQPTTHYTFEVSPKKPAVPWTYMGDTCTPFSTMYLPCEAHHLEELIYPLDLGRSAWQNFAHEAYKAFYDQMPDEVGLPNFIWEAREWRSLFSSFQELYKKRTWRDLDKRLSGSYLSWEFGWKPMLDDLRKMGAIATVVEMKLEQLRSTWGRRTRLAHSKKFTTSFDVSQDFVFTGLHGLGTRVHLKALRRQLRTGGFLYHKLDGLEDALAKTKGMLSALGMFSPAKAVWNGLRYSFVLDWFTQFGSLLDRLEIQPFSGVWDVSDVTYSVEDDWFGEIDQMSEGAVVQKAASSIHIHSYQRRVGIPLPSLIFADLGALNQKQQVLLLALVDQIR